MRRLKTRQDWTVDVFDNVNIFDAVNLFAINPATPYFENSAAGNKDEKVQERLRGKHIKFNDSKSSNKFEATEGIFFEPQQITF